MMQLMRTFSKKCTSDCSAAGGLQQYCMVGRVYVASRERGDGGAGGGEEEGDGFGVGVIEGVNICFLKIIPFSVISFIPWV